MGNHRADRRGSGRRHSGTPEASPTAGKRKAQKPARGPARGSLTRGLPSAPVLIGVAALAVSAGGAVAASEPGLVDAGSARLSQASAMSGGTEASSGMASAGLLRERGAAISRDSRRDALADAADTRLVAEAEQQAEQRDATLAQLAKKAELQSKKIARNQWELPVAGYHLTAGFGECSVLWSHCHTGLDFAAPSGTPIHAVANGVVTSAGYDGSYGNKTVITLEDGTELWYCHQTSYAVSVGQSVNAGDLIGSVGATGNVTGPHLHLEVRPGGGDPVDPYDALVQHGLQP